MPLYDDIGGAAACQHLAAAFYARVERDPVLRPFFPGKTFRCAIEQFAAFLVQMLGGPAEETQHRQWLSLRESHQRFRIGGRERDAWLALMAKALGDVPMPGSAREALQSFFERSSARLIGSEAAAPIDGELAGRWQMQESIEEAVAAVRRGDVERALALADPSCGPSRFAALLAVMMGGGHPVLRTYVRERISADPGLVHERFGGRTLLHAAAAAGDAETVELLLRSGADPNVRDAGGHTALYALGNGCRSGGGPVVPILAQAGADVNADDGIKHCTPLHMAARRGNAEVASALLNCGARIDARDSAGDTPLRRAVNCDKPEVARLLLELGADPDSHGSRRLTPRMAARSDAMKHLLRSVSRARHP
jgi:hemoglobin